MKLKSFLNIKIGILLFVIFTLSCSHKSSRDEVLNYRNIASESCDNLDSNEITKWSYDPGPDISTDLGKELIDLNADIPNMPAISQRLMNEQKFRLNFGPIPWRMPLKPNSVKILFIGQDGTHIAEAAGRPATAGFGGRAQDLAKYFGVSYSAAFINSFAYTIKGQYGSFDNPIIDISDKENPKLTFSPLVDNQLWLLSQDIESPAVKWRNKLISWIIKNNKDSLKLIVLFGGAARDSMGSFIISKGGEVGSRYDKSDLKKIRVPEIDLKYAGGNYVVPVPLDSNGNDLYEEILGKKPNYVKKENQKTNPDFEKAKLKLQSDFKKLKDKLVWPHGGVEESGVVDPAQLGGYDIDNKTVINGKNTISLKGLRIDDDLVIDHDLLFVQLPHPTALTNMGAKEASLAVAKDLKNFTEYQKNGWKIEPDKDEQNLFADGLPYNYKRADMGPEYYDFGAPASRMVNVSSASRAGHNVIVFGTRDHVNFDNSIIQMMTLALPSEYPNKEDNWTTRPQNKKERYIFDPGPGLCFAKIMKSNIPEDLLKDKNLKINKDYAHYRGTFTNPSALIIADSSGYDDLITSRALTGSRGQYLNNLMYDMGINENYLVIKTAPFSIEEKNWGEIFEKTKIYREKLILDVLRTTKPEFIIADGKYAVDEVKRIVSLDQEIPIINVIRSSDDPSANLADLVDEIRKKLPKYSDLKTDIKMKDIPRSHLSFYARLWEGTSGDRVLAPSDKSYLGLAFAEVVPEWAYAKYENAENDFEANKFLNDNEKSEVDHLIEREKNLKLRLGNESIKKYLKRISKEE